MEITEVGDRSIKVVVVLMLDGKVTALMSVVWCRYERVAHVFAAAAGEVQRARVLGRPRPHQRALGLQRHQLLRVRRRCFNGHAV